MSEVERGLFEIGANAVVSLLVVFLFVWAREVLYERALRREWQSTLAVAPMRFVPNLDESEYDEVRTWGRVVYAAAIEARKSGMPVLVRFGSLGTMAQVLSVAKLAARADREGVRTWRSTLGATWRYFELADASADFRRVGTGVHRGEERPRAVVEGRDR